MSKEAKKIYALVDCNNFFVSCERVFNPRFKNKPVVVLSNNDGVVVSRSNEVKQLGVKMGVPYFKVKEILEFNKAAVYSSNFELYSDMSKRVMEILACFTNKLEVYSIDEAFLTVEDLPDKDYAKLGKEIKSTILQWTGIPVSVGIGCTKTLAKAAGELAKTMHQTKGVLSLAELTETEVDHYLEKLEIQDVWGVGYKFSTLLKSLNITNALALKNLDPYFVRKNMHVPGLKTQKELQGIDCMSLETICKMRKSIISSRSFGNYVSSQTELLGAVSNFVTIACRKLRFQNSKAKRIGVYIRTNYHKANHKQYARSMYLNLPFHTNYTPEFIKACEKILNNIYKPNYKYAKAGVYIDEIVSADYGQKSLLQSFEDERSDAISKQVDKINASYGKESIFYGSNLLGGVWMYKQEKMSSRYTTKWKELLKAT